MSIETKTLQQKANNPLAQLTSSHRLMTVDTSGNMSTAAAATVGKAVFGTIEQEREKQNMASFSANNLASLSGGWIRIAKTTSPQAQSFLISVEVNWSHDVSQSFQISGCISGDNVSIVQLNGKIGQYTKVRVCAKHGSYAVIDVYAKDNYNNPATVRCIFGAEPNIDYNPVIPVSGSNNAQFVVYEANIVNGFGVQGVQK